MLILILMKTTLRSLNNAARRCMNHFPCEMYRGFTAARIVLVDGPGNYLMSGELMGERIYVFADLNTGERLEMTWSDACALGWKAGFGLE